MTNLMRRAIAGLGIATLLATTSGVAFAQAKVDLTGKWSFSVTTDNGTGTPTVTFKQTGDSLSGHYSSQVFGEVDFVGGKVKDGKITFAFTVSAQGQSITVSYNGTVESGDAVKGTVDLGGFGTGTWTGTRQKPSGGEAGRAEVRIGSLTPNAFLFANGKVVGPLEGVRFHAVPAGAVALTIRAEGCTQWDTTITAKAGDALTIGRRQLNCK